MVSMKGEVVPLSAMNEHNCEQMNTKEYERFEELQTQIYLGTVRERRTKTDHTKKKPRFESSLHQNSNLK